MTEPDARTAAKRAAGFAAADRFVESGMSVGLGTGSTAVWAVRRIGARLADGSLRDVVGVATSRASAAEAAACGVPLTTLDEVPRLDLTVDGADQVSADLDLIKGGGGAHLWEKVVAQASSRLVIVVDEPKLVPLLGVGFPVPVEVIRLARRPVQDFLQASGDRVELRSDQGVPFVTDQGNWILDVHTGPLPDPGSVESRLLARAGVVAVGLFVAMADVVVVAGANGQVRSLER